MTKLRERRPVMPRAAISVLVLALVPSIWPLAVAAESNAPPSAGGADREPDRISPTLRERFGVLRTLATADDNPGVADDYVALALESSDPGLQRDAAFNAGLILTRSAVKTWRQPPMPGPDGSPPPPTPYAELRDRLVEAAGLFRACVRVDPGDADAARHLELARRLIRQLDDEMEQRRQQNEERSSLADKLDELAEQQERLSQQSEQAPSDDAEGLSQQQSAIDQQTQETLDRLESLEREAQSQNPQQGDDQSSDGVPQSEALERTREAREAQEAAQEDLEDRLTKPASERQREAAERLRQAAEAAREQVQQSEQTQEQQSQEGEPNEDAEPGDQEQEGDAESGESEPGETDPTDDLLDQLEDYEEQRREQRDAIRRSLPSRSAPVERDW